MTIAVIMVNTDWAKQNKELVNNYFIAWLRGVRDYCQAFHGGPIRAEIIDALVSSGTERRPELLHKYPWPARSPNGQINVASMLDIQAWYVKSKMITGAVPRRAADRHELHRARRAEARPVRGREQGQQASRAAAEAP